MIVCKLMCCAESAVRDAPTNHVSLFNLFEDLAAAFFPLGFPKFTVVAILERAAEDPQDITGELEIMLDEKRIGEFPIEVKFGESLNSRVFVSINGMQVPGPGTFAVHLVLDGKRKGSWSFKVKPLNDAFPANIEVQNG